MSDIITTENTDHLSHVDVIGCRAYFHVMYIPLFPMWGTWILKVNDKEVMAPVEVVAKIQEKNIKIPTPWYTFVGLVVAAIVGYYFLF